jgi:hypothetical protein
MSSEMGDAGGLLTADEMRAAQDEAFGEGGVGLEDVDCATDEDRVLCKVFAPDDARVIVPPALRQRVIGMVNRSRTTGYWGILRTAAKVRSRYYWQGWMLANRDAV